jgi:hypothetical protein
MAGSDGITVGPRLTSGTNFIIGNPRMGSQEVARHDILPQR